MIFPIFSKESETIFNKKIHLPEKTQTTCFESPLAFLPKLVHDMFFPTFGEIVDED